MKSAHKDDLFSASSMTEHSKEEKRYPGDKEAFIVDWQMHDVALKHAQEAEKTHLSQ